MLWQVALSEKKKVTFWFIQQIIIETLSCARHCTKFNPAPNLLPQRAELWLPAVLPRWKFMESLVLFDANTDISDKREKVVSFVSFGYLSDPWNRKF